MRPRSRVGAVSLAVALSLTGAAAVWADETPTGEPKKAAAGSQQQNTVTLVVEGMT